MSSHLGFLTCVDLVKQIGKMEVQVCMRLVNEMMDHRGDKSVNS